MLARGRGRPAGLGVADASGPSARGAQGRRRGPLSVGVDRALLVGVDVRGPLPVAGGRGDSQRPVRNDGGVHRPCLLPPLGI